MIPSIDLLEPRNRRLVRWIGAATLIGGLHIGGGGLAMMSWPEELLQEAGGAIVVEIAPVTTTVAMDTLDLPNGLLAEEAAQTRSASDPKIEKTELDAPKEDLPSTATDPEVALQKPTKVEDPKEDPKEDPSPQVETAQEQNGAPKTTAPTRIEGAVTSTKSAAAQVGTSTANTRSIVTWQNSVVLHLNQHKRYPPSARSQHMQGDVRIRFIVDRSGQVSAASVVGSSGFELLDEEALAMLKRASPLPRPPPAMVGETFDQVVPIKFRIQ